MARNRRLLVAGAVAAAILASLTWWALTPDAPAPRRAAVAASADAGAPAAPRPRDAAWDRVGVRLAEAPAAASDAGCALSGRVVSAATGAGIAGAQLTFSLAGEANAIDAGADGAFCFDPRKAGRWTLASAVAPGYVPFAPEWGHSPVLLDARPGAKIRGVVVTLVPEERLAGRVVDPSGRPVAGAEVRVVAAGGDAAAMPLPTHLVSDANGAFQLSAPDGSEVEARHPSYGRGRARVDLAARVAGRITIALAPPEAGPPEALAISGRVDDADGSPAEGALVVAYSQRTDRDTVPRQATADASGRFEVKDLAAGPWRVLASRGNLAPAIAEGVRAGVTDLVLRLRAGGRLQGTVRDAAAAPVSPFTVRVRWRGKDRFLPPRSLTVLDASGRYELEGLVPGPALATASAPGRSPSREVEVAIPDASAPPAQVDFALAPGGRVEGQVVDGASGAPLAGARVEVEGQDAASSAIPARQGATSGPDGRFTLDGVPGGRPLSLFAQAEGHHGRVVSGVQVAEGGEVGPLTVRLSPLAPGDTPRVEVDGLGAVLAAQGSGALKVVAVPPSSHAAAAGLAAGDEVVRIEGLAVADLSFAKALRLLKDAEGGSIVLAVRKAGDASGAEQRVVVSQAAPPGAEQN